MVNIIDWFPNLQYIFRLDVYFYEDIKKNKFNQRKTTTNISLSNIYRNSINKLQVIVYFSVPIAWDGKL